MSDSVTLDALSPEWKPRIFDLSRSDEERALQALGTELRPTIHDTLSQQLRDLAATRDPARELASVELDARVSALLDGCELQRFGRWIHYPWSNRLVHLLPPDAFFELRTDRNRYKLLGDEQTRLRRATIGIVGLSVGQSAALTLALEGVGGRFRLADFDTLALSNLNRLRAGVHELGENKAVLTARAMFELDPYLDIELYPDGITDDNVESFFGGTGKLDVLVEECDDLYMKVRLRERARALGIPVIMDTSDGGLLDVERFDREPERELFHGRIPGLRAAPLKGLPTKEKVPFVLAILGVERMSPGMAASLCEVKETLSTWPQLGSAVALGGALVTDTARRILLDQFHDSGRFYVNLDETVRDGRAVPSPAFEPLEVEVAAEARSAPAPIAAPAVIGETLTRDVVRFLVAHAVLAPSGGNVQPWRFSFDGTQLDCFLDEARSAAFLNFEHLASYAAIGAAVENMSLAAATVGLVLSVETFPTSDATLVCRITARRGQGSRDELFDALRLRVTNRRLAPPRVLGESDQTALRGALARAGSRLAFLTERTQLSELGHMLGVTDRMRFLSPLMHRELMKEIRWSPAEVAATRDGFDLATLELTPTDKAVMRVLSSPSTMAYLRRLGGGRGLERPSEKAMAAASAAALLSVEGTSRDAYVAGGRELQRVWLTATKLGLAVHPQGLPYVFTRFERGSGFTAEEHALVARLHPRWRALFAVPAGHAEILLLRLAHADPPSARALRRPVDAVLTLK